jgi:2,3-dimethylmalate lyase
MRAYGGQARDSRGRDGSQDPGRDRSPYQPRLRHHRPRTDARAVEGFERSLARARRYLAAGADALFIEALTSEDEVAQVARAFPGVPLLFNWAEGGKTPPVSLARLRELGYRIVIFPISTLLAATAAMRRILQEIAQAGTPAAALGDLPSFGEFVDFIGLPEVRVAEHRYAAIEPADTEAVERPD